MMNPMMNPMMMQMMQQMMGGSMPNMKKMKGAGKGGVDKAICSTHFKERSLRNLADDGEGGHCCTEGEECKPGGSDLRNSYCTAHKKKRSEQSLVDDGAGGKQCAEGMECQMGADRGSDEKVECSTHGKTRSMRSCADDGSGGYACAEGSECQMGAGEAAVRAKPAVKSKFVPKKAVVAQKAPMKKAGKASGKWR